MAMTLGSLGMRPIQVADDRAVRCMDSLLCLSKYKLHSTTERTVLLYILVHYINSIEVYPMCTCPWCMEFSNQFCPSDTVSR